MTYIRDNGFKELLHHHDDKCILILWDKKCKHIKEDRTRLYTSTMDNNVILMKDKLEDHILLSILCNNTICDKMISFYYDDTYGPTFRYGWREGNDTIYKCISCDDLTISMMKRIYINKTSLECNNKWSELKKQYNK